MKKQTVLDQPPLLFFVVMIVIVIGTSLALVLSLQGSEGPMEELMGEMPVFSFSRLGDETLLFERLCPCSRILIPATNEREISNTVFNQGPGESIPDPRGLSTWVWVILQFLDHDITLTESDSTLPRMSIHFNDQIMMHLMQKQTVTDPVGCKLAKNFISVAVDGTNIYGDYRDPEHAKSLRTGVLGQMKVNSKGFLPRNPENPNEFLAGDKRSTEHALLALMHTLFVREHNRIAKEMHEMMPTWSDDQLYWKALQVNVAQYQRILYEEVLPALFGEQAYKKYVVGASSKVLGAGMTVASEFSNTAFRFGHSMVANNVGRFPLKDLFFNADFLENTGLETLILEAQKTPSQQVDTKVVNGLRNILFGNFGEDLVTRNLFRARELEVSTYQQLADCYGFPSDPLPENTDGLVGLLSEPLMEGSSLPRGLATIVGEQLQRSFSQDPHFYKSSKAQIGSHFYKQVESTTFRDIVVRNTALTEQQLPANMFFMTAK